MKRERKGRDQKRSGTGEGQEGRGGKVEGMPGVARKNKTEGFFLSAFSNIGGMKKIKDKLKNESISYSAAGVSRGHGRNVRKECPVFMKSARISSSRGFPFFRSEVTPAAFVQLFSFNLSLLYFSLPPKRGLMASLSKPFTLRALLLLKPRACNFLALFPRFTE